MLKHKLLDATSEELTELRKYFSFRNYHSSNHSFSSVYMWGFGYNLSWEVIDGYLWLLYEHEDEDGAKAYWSTAPAYLERLDKESFTKSFNEFVEKVHAPLRFYQVPAYMAEYFPPARFMKNDRDNWDYVYERDKLVSLSGKALHKKKNHLNYFLKNFEYEFEELKPEDINEAIEFVRGFNVEKTTEGFFENLSLENEAKAVEMALKAYEKGDLQYPVYHAYVIKIDGEIKAFTLGAYADEDEFITHIEKADVEHRGLYQAINWELAKALNDEVKYIDREEDMGLMNLRQSKEGYKPCKMYEKYYLEY